jgi:hypothetical protein
MTKVNPPDYWVRPFQPLKNEAGMQRFVWDLLYPNPPADRYDLPISAIYKDTPFTPQGHAVMPGKYTVKLTANGKTLTQILTVRIDPRIITSTLDLRQQFDLSMQAYEGVKQTYPMIEEAKKLKGKVDAAKLDLLLNGTKPPTQNLADLPLNRLNSAFAGLLDLLQDADVKPTTQAIKTAQDLQIALAKALKTWNETKVEAEKKISK